MIGMVRRHRLWSVAVLVVLTLLIVESVGLVQLHSNVGRYRDYWGAPRGDPGGLLYVALGDSTAQGIGASRPDRGYVGLVAERLRRSTGRPVTVVNLSRSGARIADLLSDQLPRLRELHPDLVTVAIGGNDVRAYDRQRFAAQVDELTAALPAGSVLADVPYFMHGHWERDARQAADTVSLSATKHGLPIVALHAALVRQGAVAMLTQFAPDWFHPNDAGYQVWGNAFWTTIADLPVSRTAP
jgi:lysophospholipase L1-like esterase